MRKLLTVTTMAALAVCAGLSPSMPAHAQDRCEGNGTGRFGTWEQAITYVRQHYRAETADTSRSGWITSAEYYPADGCGYLILGMRGKPYIFAGVPPAVWDEFRTAPSPGSYYNQSIKGRYYFRL